MWKYNAQMQQNKQKKIITKWDDLIIKDNQLTKITGGKPQDRRTSSNVNKSERNKEPHLGCYIYSYILSYSVIFKE